MYSLPWIEHPVETDTSTRIAVENVPKLHSVLKTSLLKRKNSTQHEHEVRSDGFSDFLAPQWAMWNITGAGFAFHNDLCLSFPTGSGKTLAYTLPILQNLIQ